MTQNQLFLLAKYLCWFVGDLKIHSENGKTGINFHFSQKST